MVKRRFGPPPPPANVLVGVKSVCGTLSFVDERVQSMADDGWTMRGDLFAKRTIGNLDMVVQQMVKYETKCDL